MKILFIETSDDGTVGGSHTCMYNLVRHMDRTEMNFTVAFYRDNSAVQKIKDLGVPVRLLPIRNPHTGSNSLVRKALNWYVLEYRAARYLKDYLAGGQFDLVLLNNSIFRSLIFVSVCNELRIPLVAYERGFAPHGTREARASEGVQCSIAVSDAVCAHLHRAGLRSRRIERIYDGIDQETHSGRRDREVVKAELGIPRDSPVIGIIGNVKPWKGQRFFVEAFIDLARTNESLYGVIIGGCAESDRPFLASLTELVRGTGFEHRLLFLGYRSDVADLLPALDVFVHASTKPEPFGMVILEAMAACRPVVATELGGPIEILDGGACGRLVPPGNGRAIADACRDYLEDQALVVDRVTRASARLREHFSVAHTVQQTAALFRLVLDSHHERGSMKPLKKVAGKDSGRRSAHENS